MATWYVREDTSHNSTRNGTSYATAWGGWSEIVWGASGVNAGDTLYICGTFNETTANLTVGAHGSSSAANATTLRGDASEEAGVLNFVGANKFLGIGARHWTTVRNLTIYAGTTNCIFNNAANGNSVIGCSLFGGADGTAPYSMSSGLDDTTIENCTINGGNRGISMLITVASAINERTKIRNNVITGQRVRGAGSGEGIRLSVETAAIGTGGFSDVLIEGNETYGNDGVGILVRDGPTDTTTQPSIYSVNVRVYNNYLHDSGITAGANGASGGLAVAGCDTPIIAGNRVYDCFAQGGGIQTAKNTGMRCFANDVRRIRSGTPSGSFQNGLPIDGNGIFIDNLNIGARVFNNYVEGLVTTGNNNSGTAYAFWNCTTSVFYGNVAYDVYRGMSYGNSTETGNEFYNNTIVLADVGVTKIGTNTLTGNITVKNNIFKNCTTGFSIGANPGITEDYNWVEGATTAYSGISKGANSQTGASGIDASTYRPGGGSAVKGAGVHIGPGYLDKAGIPFLLPPSIGAYEVPQTAGVGDAGSI